MSFDIEFFLQYWILDNRYEVAQNQDVVYRTRNLFATDERYIYIFIIKIYRYKDIDLRYIDIKIRYKDIYFSDPPHLVKKQGIAFTILAQRNVQDTCGTVGFICCGLTSVI